MKKIILIFNLFILSFFTFNVHASEEGIQKVVEAVKHVNDAHPDG
jgi:hypothetical protein